MQRPQPAAALLAAAAALLALPIHAQGTAGTSKVTVYGLIDAAVRRADNSTASGGSTTSMGDGIFTGSRFGLRGSEDLGGGLRAVFTLESGFSPATGASLQGTATADYGQEATSRFWGRDVHVGLRNTWGGIALGRQYTTAHQIAARFQPQGNPNNQALALFSSHHVARQDHLVRVDGKFGNVDAQASYTLGGQSSSKANSSWAVGGGYRAGALQLGAYVQQMHNRAGTETRKILGLGGNYAFSKLFALFAGVMQRTHEVSAQKNRAWTLGANFQVTPALTLSAAHFDDSQSGSAVLDGSREVSWIAAIYKLSRRTDVYAELDHNRVEGGYAKPSFMGTLGSQTGLSAGLRHRF